MGDWLGLQRRWGGVSPLQWRWGPPSGACALFILFLRSTGCYVEGLNTEMWGGLKPRGSAPLRPLTFTSGSMYLLLAHSDTVDIRVARWRFAAYWVPSNSYGFYRFQSAFDLWPCLIQLGLLRIIERILYLSTFSALHRYGLLLQMSHVAWSVCLSVCWWHRYALLKRLNLSRCRLRGADSRWLKELRINR